MNKQTYNINIESTILSSILYSPTLLQKYANKIDTKLFFLPLHKKVISIILELYKENKTIDEIIILNTIGKEFENDLVYIISKKPIANIEEAIKRVAQGNYSYRILSKKKNEFNILISSFNNMIKEIEKSRTKLKHTEQISTWQDIATRLAHEIRNPLTPIKLSAQRVLLKGDGTLDKMTVNYMETIIQEVIRMEKLLTEFRDFSRFPKVLLESHSIKKIIEDGVGLYLDTFPNVKFSLSGVEDITLYLDKNQIIQVISNLTINAIHAMDDKGEIYYLSEIVYKKGQKFCRVGIKDSGCGISQDVVQNIFKPYYTTKFDGSGLGLAIVNKIILDHKGKIWIETAVGIGTTFYFELPVEII